MNCEKCKNPLPLNTKICPSCGTEVKVNTSKNEVANDIIIEGKKVNDKKTFDQVVSFCALFFGFIIAKYIGAGFLFFLGGGILGQWFPKWYLKRNKININLVKWIVWSNVITWLFPIIGIITGFAALEFGNHFPNDRKKYKTIAVIGIVASLLNIILGILIPTK
ncbi:MAG: hypothetical protein WCC74_03575 [Minisyncoccia bacterium]